MFKLGEYHEDEARGIAKFLKEAGMKVDVRTFTDGEIDTIDFLEGRMSELKGEMDEKRFGRYEKYINALRAVLARGATSENFSEMFQTELDPEVNERRAKLCEIFEGGLSKEEPKMDSEKFAAIMANLIEISNAESFVGIVLERNGIEIGEGVGERLDDPILRVFYDPEDEDEEEHRLARITTILTFSPVAEVYIDELSATLAEELDDEFKEKYDEEFFKIKYLAAIIHSLMESSSGKTDLETFSEKCSFQIEDDGNILEVDGRGAAQEIARSLEKGGIIKVKGESIKWKL